MEVPAGQGKSRIAAALAYFVLNHSPVQVHLLYPNKGLRKRDEREYAGLFSVLFRTEPKTKSRLHYAHGVSGVKGGGESVLIVDESDEVMFGNLRAFWQMINQPERKVICLTAASDDDYDKGVERKALEAIGFKVYKKSPLRDRTPPTIHQEVDLSDFGVVMEVIQKQRETRGVLVYANG
jgi:hypothetical protein